MAATIKRDAAERFADEALSLMRRHHVAPTPHNYVIWYDYVAGWTPDLRHDVEAMVTAENLSVSTESERLFDKYYSVAGQQAIVAQANVQLVRSIGDVIGHVQTAGRRHAVYCESLEGFSTTMVEQARRRDDSDTGSILVKILSETRDVIEHNKVLERRLNESAAELANLRGDLEEIRRQAATDALTGLANRMTLDQTLRTLAYEAAQSGEPLALVIADIDNFKQFNDRYGHAIGDEVLRVVARVLIAQVKGRDTVARYGGEEFALVLPGASTDGALAVSEQIRDGLAKKQLVNRSTGGSLGTITMSMGIAGYIAHEPMADFVERADAALYRAKREGRNRCVIGLPGNTPDVAG